MDKPEKNNSITIKINGKESPIIEDREKKEEEEQKQETADSYESLNQETASAKESEDDPDAFQWILPNEEKPPIVQVQEDHLAPVEQKKQASFKIKPIFRRTIKKQPFQRVNPSTFLAIFFAVLLGTFFGLMLLKVVPAEKAAEPAQSVMNKKGQEETPVNNSGKVEGVLTAVTTGVVQEGIYSTKEGAEEKKAALTSRGIPAEVFSFHSQFALFVGIADNVTDAKNIGNQYEASGIETYSKEFSVSEKSINNLEEEEKKLLSLIPAVFQSFVTKADIATQASNLAGIDKKKLQNQTILNMYNELESASVQLKLYEKDPTADTDKKVQQHLLTFLANYQSL